MSTLSHDTSPGLFARLGAFLLDAFAFSLARIGRRIHLWRYAGWRDEYGRVVHAAQPYHTVRRVADDDHLWLCDAVVVACKCGRQWFEAIDISNLPAHVEAEVVRHGFGSRHTGDGDDAA